MSILMLLKRVATIKKNVSAALFPLFLSLSLSLSQRKYDNGGRAAREAIEAETRRKKRAIVWQLFSSRFRFRNLRGIKATSGPLVATGCV